MSRALLAGVLLVVVAAGCTTSSAGIAPASRPLAPDGYTVLNTTSGTSWGFSLLGLLPLKQASTADALDDALRSRGADSLVQVSVDNRNSYLVLASLQRIKVQGLAVKSK